MDRKKILEEFVKEMHSKYLLDKEDESSLSKICQTLSDPAIGDKEFHETLKFLDRTYNSMNEIRKQIRELKKRTGELRKEDCQLKTPEYHKNKVLELHNGIIYKFNPETAIEMMKHIKTYEN